MTVRARRSLRRVLLTALCVLVLLFALAALGLRLYYRLGARSYYDASEPAFPIPGLSDGFIPQGLSYDAPEDLFLVTGYQKDGSASPVYLVDRASGEARGKVLLTTPDGTAYTGHAGGLTVHGDYLYVAGGGSGLYVYRRADLLAAQDGDALPCVGIFPTAWEGDAVGVAFTATDGERLYAGQFYREENYPTPDSHKRTTAAGDYNTALMLAYDFSDGPDSILGLSPAPAEVYSLPGLVQGACFDGDTLWLSTSYGMPFSHLYAYDLTRANRTETDLFGGLPLTELDSACRVREWKIAPMSEEIEIVDGKLYTMCESASSKYLFGNLLSARTCYATWTRYRG